MAQGGWLRYRRNGRDVRERARQICRVVAVKKAGGQIDVIDRELERAHRVREGLGGAKIDDQRSSGEPIERTGEVR